MKSEKTYSVTFTLESNDEIRLFKDILNDAIDKIKSENAYMEQYQEVINKKLKLAKELKELL